MTDLDRTIAAWRENGTPGPWKADLGEAFHIRENDRSSLAQMRFLHGFGDIKGRRNDDSVANTARLIASAPAMADEIDRLRKQLKATLEREAETHRRHDQKLDAKDARIAELEARVADLQTGQDNLIEALTPSGCTKADYMGEFSFTVHEDDPPADVPWTTIKEIMLHIITRAIKEKKNDNDT